jgi:hypothetical protein
MSKEQYRSDSRLKNISEKEDASTSKDSDKLIEVKKKDTAEDKDNDFLVHEKPFDEQMHEDDDRGQHSADEEAD